MKKVRLQDHASIILLRTSGKGQDDRSAQAMKILKINRSRARKGKRPPEFAHRHFRHPEGGDMFWFQDEQRILFRKKGLLYAPGALLEGGIFGVCRNEAQSYTAAQLGRGEKKKM